MTTHLSVLALFFMCLSLITQGEGCSPVEIGREGRANKQTGVLGQYDIGIELVEPNPFILTEYTNLEYIREAEELNCDFSVPESCAWTNSEADSEDFYVVSKTNNKPFPEEFYPNGPNRSPSSGDRFLFTGSGEFPATQALLLSTPVKCLKKGGILSFSYWLAGLSKVRVMLLDPKNSEVLWASDPEQCTALGSVDGVCRVDLPLLQGPAQLAVHAFDLQNSLVIIDDISLEADLYPACAEDIYRIGTKQAKYISASSGKPITKTSDLNCMDFEGCLWSATTVKGEAAWIHHLDEPEAQQWQLLTKSIQQPETFMAASGRTGVASFTSDPIRCQAERALLTFKSWSTEGVDLFVCAVNADDVTQLLVCSDVPRSSKSFQRVVIPGGLNNFRIQISAKGWNNRQGGMIALDDIRYSGQLCDFTTTTTRKTTTQTERTASTTKLPTTRRVTTTKAPITTSTLASTTEEELIPEIPSIVDIVTSAPIAPEGSDLECATVNCDFEISGHCVYRVFTEAGDVAVEPRDDQTPDQNERVVFARNRGRFGNQVTGVRDEENESYYGVAYLLAGHSTAMVAQTELIADRLISFRYYQATHGMEFHACCDNDCSWTMKTELADAIGKWQQGQFECPKGTSQLSFRCDNDGADSRHQGACAIDDVKLWKKPTRMERLNRSFQTAC